MSDDRNNNNGSDPSIERSDYEWTSSKDLEKKVNKANREVGERGKTFSDSNEVRKWDTEDRLRNDYYDSMLKEAEERRRILAEEERRRTQGTDNLTDKIANKINSAKEEYDRKIAEENARRMAGEKRINEENERRLREEEFEKKRKRTEELQKKSANNNQNNSQSYGNSNNVNSTINNTASMSAHSSTRSRLNTVNNSETSDTPERMLPALNYNTLARQTAYGNVENLQNAPDRNINYQNSTNRLNGMNTCRQNRNTSNTVTSQNNEEAENYRTINARRNKAQYHLDQLLEVMGRSAMLPLEEVRQTDEYRAYTMVKSKLDLMTDSMASLAAHSSTRNQLNKINDSGMQGLQDALEGIGRRSQFMTNRTITNEDGTTETVSRFWMGVDRRNIDVLMKEFDIVGRENHEIARILNGRKASQLSEREIRVILANPTLSRESRNYFNDLLKAKSYAINNMLRNQFAVSIRWIKLGARTFLGETEEARVIMGALQIESAVVNALKAAKTTLGWVGKVTKKSVEKTALGIANSLPTPIKNPIARIDRRIGRSLENNRVISRMRSFNRINRQAFFHSIPHRVGRGIRRVVNRIPVVNRIRNSRFGRTVSRIYNNRTFTAVRSGFKRVANIDLFKPFSQFFDIIKRAKKFIIKMALGAVGLTLVLACLLTGLSAMRNWSSFLSNSKDYVKGIIKGWFPVTEDHSVKFDELGWSMTSTDPIAMLVNYEEDYIRELQSIGENYGPRGADQYFDKYGGVFNENYGENVKITWVNQHDDIIPYEPNIKDIISLASVQLQQGRTDNSIIFNTYCTRLWRYSHMYNMYEGDVSEAFDKRVDDVGKPYNYRYDAQKEIFRIDYSDNKYKFRPGGETGKQIIMCPEDGSCGNTYRCAITSDIKNKKISFELGHGQGECWNWKIKPEDMNATKWISGAWKVESGAVVIGSYVNMDTWTPHNNTFKKDGITYEITDGPAKLTEEDNLDQILSGDLIIRITTPTEREEERVTKDKDGKEVKTTVKVVEDVISYTNISYSYNIDKGDLTLGGAKLKGSSSKVKRYRDFSACKGHCGGHPYAEVTCRMVKIDEDKLKIAQECEKEGKNKPFETYYDKKTIYKAALRQYYAEQYEIPELKEDMTEKEKKKIQEKIDKINAEIDEKTDKAYKDKFPWDLVDIDVNRHISYFLNMSYDIYIDNYSDYKRKGKIAIELYRDNNTAREEKLVNNEKNKLKDFNYNVLFRYYSKIENRLYDLGAFNTANFLEKVKKEVQKYGEKNKFDFIEISKSAAKYDEKMKDIDKMSVKEMLLYIFPKEKNFIIVDPYKFRQKPIDLSNIDFGLIDDINTDIKSINIDTINAAYSISQIGKIKEQINKDETLLEGEKIKLIQFIEELNKYIKHKLKYSDKINEYIIEGNGTGKYNIDISKMSAKQVMSLIFKKDYYYIYNSRILYEKNALAKEKRKEKIKDVNVYIDNKKKTFSIDVSKLDGLYMYKTKNISNADYYNMGKWSVEDELWAYHFYNQDWSDKYKGYGIDIKTMYYDCSDVLKDKIGSTTWGGEAALSTYIDAVASGGVVEYALKAVGAKYSQAKRTQIPEYYDCSSLAYYSWKSIGLKLGNVNYPPVAAAEAKWLKDKGVLTITNKIKQEDLIPGDLIFFSYESNGRYLNISHVAIYVGQMKDGYCIVEAANSDKGVIKSKFKTYGVVAYGRPGALLSNVPNNEPGCKSEVKTYMSYTALGKGTARFKYVCNGPGSYTHSKYGIRMTADDRYCVAIGTGFLKGTPYNKVTKDWTGTKITVCLANGTQLKCTVGDIKSDAHTDKKYHKYHVGGMDHGKYYPGDGSVLEFIVDTNVYKGVNHKKEFEGKIISILIDKEQ